MEPPRPNREAYRKLLIAPLATPPRPRSASTPPSPKIPLSPSPIPRSTAPPPPSSSQMKAPASLETSECEELQKLDHAPPFWKDKRRLSKQLSMCETARDRAWEKRRRQMLRQEKRKNGVVVERDDLTDEDLHELKGSIELGFGFKEVDGKEQRLCNTLPALDFYFAVERQQTWGSGSGRSFSSLDSPSSCSRNEGSWKICGPGDNPQQVKNKLRHWAQAVACSVMQSF